MLQADPKVKAAMTAKPAKPAAGAGAMDAMAKQLGGTPPAATPAAEPAAAEPAAAEPAAAEPAAANTMANAPVSATNTAAADNPNQQQTKNRGGRVKGAGPSMTPGAVRRRETRAAAAKQSKVGNAVMGQIANQVTQQNASKINHGNNLSEMLAANIEKHKKKLAEERAANYKNASIFTK